MEVTILLNVRVCTRLFENKDLNNFSQKCFFFLFTANFIHPQSLTTACSSSTSRDESAKSSLFLSPQLAPRSKKSGHFESPQISDSVTSGSCPSLVDPPQIATGSVSDRSASLVPSVDFPFQFNFGSTYASSITLFFDN